MIDVRGDQAVEVWQRWERDNPVFSAGQVPDGESCPVTPDLRQSRTSVLDHSQHGRGWSRLDKNLKKKTSVVVFDLLLPLDPTEDAAASDLTVEDLERQRVQHSDKPDIHGNSRHVLVALIGLGPGQVQTESLLM